MGSCNSGGKGNSSGGTVTPILGKKGRAKTSEEALSNANPNFDPKDPNNEYGENCQRVVLAYEALRQGYDVEALPAILDKLNDPMFDNGNWMNGFQGQTWTGYGELGKRNKQVAKNIVSQMQEWGDGSRAIAYVAWKRGNAHVFNIENKGGEVSVFDAQDGKQYKLREYISDAKPTFTMISRVDNLKPNLDVMQYAVKKKGS